MDSLSTDSLIKIVPYYDTETGRFLKKLVKYENGKEINILNNKYTFTSKVFKLNWKKKLYFLASVSELGYKDKFGLIDVITERYIIPPIFEGSILPYYEKALFYELGYGNKNQKRRIFDIELNFYGYEYTDGVLNGQKVNVQKLVQKDCINCPRFNQRLINGICEC